MVTAGESIFASRSFRQFYLGQAFSYLGEGLRFFIFPLLVFNVTRNPLLTAVTYAFEFAPFTLFNLVAGSFADRIDRRFLMIASDFVRFLVIGIFIIAYMTHTLSLFILYSGLTVMSICAAFFIGGQAVSIPYVLSKEHATEAYSTLMATESAANSIAPAIGAFIGPLPSLLINAFTYVASQFSLSRIPTLGPDVTQPPPTLRELIKDIRLGFAYMMGDPPMRAYAFLGFALNVFGIGAFGVLIPFLKLDLGANDHQVGLFMSITSVGAIAGSIFSARYARKWSFGRALTVAYFFDATIFLPIYFLHNMWAIAIIWAITNATVNFEIAQIVGWRIRVTPHEMIGRVTGAVRVVALSGMVPGLVFSGMLANQIGPRSVMGITAVAYFVIAIGATLLPVIRNEAR